MPQKQKHVFVWTNYRQWRKVVLRLLNDLLDKGVLEELRKNPPAYIVADKLEWLDKAIKKVKMLPNSDICTIFLERFQNHYHFVRGFHGCRAESSESYQQNGIRPSNPSSLNEIARQIFQRKMQLNLRLKTWIRAIIHIVNTIRGKFAYASSRNI